MTDPRADQLAKLVLDYSIGLKERDRLVIQYDPSYSEYAFSFSRQAKQRGAEVYFDQLSFNPIHLRSLVERSKPEELQQELERRNEIYRWCNTRVMIDTGTDDGFADGIQYAERKVANYEKMIVGPSKKVLYRPADKNELKRNREKERTDFVRWNIVGFPSRELARQNKMSFQEFQDFVYSATLVPNWKEMEQKMQVVKQAFDSAKNVHIYVPNNIDLHLSLEARQGEVCAGKYNMPDGEIFYSPVENSAQGHIHFQHPSMRNTGKIEGIRLNFQEGRVVAFDARQGRKTLEETLAIDEGASRIGELGIGFNSGIKKPIMNVLFDEKIAGTIHLALGEALSKDFSSGGGLNESEIHWDIVCDLRRDPTNLQDFPGGFIALDDKVVQENGEWKI